ncbi:MAG: formylglycine-generating enzyme family protein, partial [Gammaproteobacteria bacterium]|nr:formylglycine-generating enzyme family protein [Gammaproteobacteria bacterium]
SAEEKQQFLDKIPAMPEKDIQQYINKLDLEYQAANPKATEIYLYPYYIDREPVSNAEYQAFCSAAEHSCPTHWPDGKIPDKTADLPVVNISLEDAKAYAQWAGKEIPTAPEWEKACRGEQGILYPWGNEWDESRVKAKDGAIRKQFDAEYLELNAAMPEHGGLVHFKTPCFTLPPHQLELDEAEFLSYLQGSISLTADEKHRIVAALPRLTQAQIDELLRILREEKEKFLALDKQHEPQLNQQRKKHYVDLMEPELAELCLNALQEPAQNESPCGIRELAGSIYQMTVSESGGAFLIKGGSWFSENPREACQAWAAETINARDKRMDAGFRCVKPIFS